MARSRSRLKTDQDDFEIPVGPEPAGIGYGVLRDEGKRNVLVQRAAQLEQEHYNHALNRKIFEGQIDSPGARQQIEAAKAAMVSIEAALAVVTAEVALMQPEADPE